MMKIRTSREGKVAQIALAGRMEAESREQLQTAGDQLIGEGATHIAVDLSGLTYISSAGIGVLVRLSSLLREKGGEVALCGASGVVLTVLQITRVITLFQMRDDTAGWP